MEMAELCFVSWEDCLMQLLQQLRLLGLLHSQIKVPCLLIIACTEDPLLSTWIGPESKIDTGDNRSNPPKAPQHLGIRTQQDFLTQL